jgi:rhamnosyltransferase
MQDLSTNGKSSIGGLIVAYHFDAQTMSTLVEAFQKQVDWLIIVDNSDTDQNEWFAKYGSDVCYLPLNENKGIAYAQNIGIKLLLDKGCDYILFSDQDSIPPEHLTVDLYSSYRMLKAHDPNVQGVAPSAYNKHTGETYSYQSEVLADLTIEDHPYEKVSYLMNSGAFIAAEAFKQAGLMDAQLFIDGVDSEWCWRAAQRIHATFYVDKNIKLAHFLGIGNKKIGGKERSITPPFRMYYQYRNFIWLLKRKYVPASWKRYNGKKYLIKLIYYPLFIAPRFQYLKNITKGINSGLRAQ